MIELVRWTRRTWGLGDHLRCFGRVTDRLDAMAVGIEHEGAVIVGVILRPEPRRAVVAPAGGERRRMERAHRRAVGRTEAEMRAGDRCLDAP